MAKALAKAEPNIDIVSLFKLLEFEPHSEAQWEYCASKTRFNIPCCGRRWGKSQAAGHRATLKAFIPNSYTWIVGPTYRLGEKEFRVVWDDFEKLGIFNYKSCRKQYSVNQGNMRIQTPWGSVVEVVSAEKPDGLLGEGLSHVVMSEAARHNRETWEQYIEPALSDLEGTADFPSTPKGYNWYHGLWMLGQEGFAQKAHAASYRSWQFPTWTNAARYPEGLENKEIQRLKAVSSEVYFNQEYGAQFTSISGAIYDEWNEQVHVHKHEYRPDWPNYLAFDYGYANAFVCLDIQVSPNDDVYVWREYYGSYVSTYEHGQNLVHRNRFESPKGYRIDGMWGDPRGADEAATLALTLGYVASQDVPWKLGVEAMKRLMKPDDAGNVKLHVDPSCVNLKRQLGQLHVKDASRRSQDINELQGDGNIQHKVDDHAADALRYFVGPYFVMGANSHLEDTYGIAYRGSESEDFLRHHGNPFTLGNDTFVRLG